MVAGATEVAAPLLAVRDLAVSFGRGGDAPPAVAGVDLEVGAGEIVGVVGESGSGKSVTATAVMGLVEPPGRIVGGSVRLRGRELTTLSERRMRDVRGGDVAMIWQDPMASLNPVRRIGDQLAEALRLHWPRLSDAAPTRRRVRAAVLAGLRDVNVPDAERRMREYPHELSGGLQQRVMIAMGLACRPSLLIADEPTTALDVTIQAQILDLLQTLRRERHMSILLITHDLGVVAETCDRVVVMYAGKIVERASTRQLFTQPKHPYTRGLLNSMPRGTARERPLEAIRGSVPELHAMPPGCAFHPRCPEAMEVCRREPPQPSERHGHGVSCHLHG
jgi:oligopeptide/dipeptide ABC transporter ATP-binding protein